GTDLPRAYLIPAGSTDAATLVDHLLAHGVEVGTADAAFSAGGRDYPAGTFVVDLHQPLRGLANVLLSDGSDISDRVPTMYDISATPLTVAPPAGSFPQAADYVRLELAGVAAVQAVNAVLAGGAAVADLGDGTVLVGPDGLAAAETASETYGVAFTADDGTALTGDDVRGLAPLRVGFTSTAGYAGEDELALRALGFADPVRVTAQGLAAGEVDLADIDVLWLGAPLGEDETAVQALADYFAAGKGVVAAAEAGAWAATTFGLFDAAVVSGPNRANGVVL